MPNKPKPSEDAGPVSLKAIAEAGGVSLGTVSMALNDNPLVAEKTRKRLKALAEEMGYRRSPAFAALGSRRRWARAVNEGVPVACVQEARPNEPRYLKIETLRQGMTDEGARLGFRVEPFFLKHGEDWRPLLRTLHARGFAAIIVQQMMTLKALELPDWSRFVVVALGQQTQPLPMLTVRFSRQQSAREAVKRIWAKGYRRIGFLEGMHGDFVATEDFARHAGVLAGLREVGVPLEEIIPPLEHRMRELPERKFRAWMRKHRPDALLSTNGWPTLEQVRAYGCRVPEAISFACLLGGDPVEIACPLESYQELGAAGMRQCDDLLRHGEYGLRDYPQQLIVPFRWQEGRTLAERRPKPRSGSRNQTPAGRPR